MDFEVIVPLVLKGVTLVASLLTADNIAAAERAWTAVTAIIKPPETVTQADLDAVEAELDALIDEFNVDLPPE